MSTFVKMSLWERLMRWLSPARKRAQDEAIRAEIRRLMVESPDEPVRFR